MFVGAHPERLRYVSNSEWGIALVPNYGICDDKWFSDSFPRETAKKFIVVRMKKDFDKYIGNPKLSHGFKESVHSELKTFSKTKKNLENKEPNDLAREKFKGAIVEWFTTDDIVTADLKYIDLAKKHTGKICTRMQFGHNGGIECPGDDKE